MNRTIDITATAIQKLEHFEVYGRVTKILGLLIEVKGLGAGVSIGTMIHLRPEENGLVRDIPCEVIGFRDAHILLMPFGTLEGVGLNCKAVIQKSAAVVTPNDRWLGRVINALGEPIDGKGPLSQGAAPIPLKNKPPPPHARNRLGPQLDLGIRTVNSFIPTCQGQRLGIFAGSGVGKSVLLSMMARYTQADISVIGLVGERGREVQEFLEDDLGPEGLARSVVVVATGDEPALMRRQAAYMTLAISEYFRDRGKQVLCLMDSVTRFAMAQREIGLSAGEPPTAKGYPPTTFGELARLLERAGQGTHGQGAITGLFSVLVEGDDHNEPVADAVRGIVDGHIVMDRTIADRGRYPAIDVLKSVSRALPKIFTDEKNTLIKRGKHVIGSYEDMAELIRLGAYRKGSDPDIDEAMALYPHLERFLTQDKDDKTSIEDGFETLAQILGVPYNGDMLT